LRGRYAKFRNEERQHRLRAIENGEDGEAAEEDRDIGAPELGRSRLDPRRGWLRGEPVARVGELLNVLSDTLRKAIAAGRLPPVQKKRSPARSALLRPTH
jgi:hypothetical protein